MHEGTHSSNHSRLMAYAIGGALVVGAIVIAPHILPMLGIGSSAAAGEALTVLHGTATGLAGFLNEGVAMIPLIGTKLAEGGLFNAAVTGMIGLGGSMLGYYLDQRDDGSQGIRWGRVITTAALLTSTFIALPSILTALSAGAIYLSSVATSYDTHMQFIKLAADTTGSIGGLASATYKSYAGLSGIAATLPHFITCGLSFVPAVASFFVPRLLNGAEETYVSRPAAPRPENWSERVCYHPPAGYGLGAA